MPIELPVDLLPAASQVLVDPPGPFSVVPTPQLEMTGNTVMQLMLSTLQKTFIQQLADDYNRSDLRTASFLC